MGLILAAAGAISNTLKDQWKEFFYCDTLPADVLVARGYKRNTKNNKGNDNVITNGSKIVVAEGQCVIIVEDGRVVEVCAEPGGYTYDTTQAPTVFAGGFGAGLVASFKKALENFSYGGSVANDQRIYYFNTKEILNNRFGTMNPVPFRIVDNNIGLDIDTSIRCNGTYCYRVTDPILFYANISGNVGDMFRQNNSDFEMQLKSEFLNALQPAFAEISAMGIRYSAVPGHTTELCAALQNALKEDWAGSRGITLTKISINSLTIPPEDEQMIKEAQRAAINRNPGMAAASLVTAQAQAMQDAANNPNGAMMGFMGMGMAQQAGGMDAQALFNMQAQQAAAAQQAAPAAAPAAPAANSWTCSCGTVNTGKFCTECATPKPAPAEGWTCSCGAVNQGKFCQECGKAKPAGAPLYKCDKCGWTPEDPKNPPKFCPECGDVFDDNDVQ